MYRLKNNILLSISLVLLSFIAHSCTNSDDSTPVQIMRLDKALATFGHDTALRQTAIIDSMGPEIRAMMSVVGVTDVTDSVLIAWSESKVVEMFQPPVDSVFKSLHPLENIIGDMMSRSDKELLELPPLKFASVVWGSQRPLVRIDSIVLIALNHYLGADFEGYAGWPEYRRSQKSPDMIPYNLAGVLAATQYPMVDDEPTLLSWMLYEGALVEARMRLVPGASLHKALGYTQEQLDFAESNLHSIWDEMRLQRLVYDTNPQTIDKFIASAPYTPLLGGKAPGQIGRYVGYRIVRSYLKKHPGTSLPEMLSKAFYASSSTLIDSGFNP